MMKRFTRKLSSVLLRIQIRMKEKKYERIKYLLQANRSSDTLLICFSGFNGSGPARYNYIKTLTTVKANKLFILDDFGYNKQGSYYLGENGECFVPDMIVGLIKKIQSDRDIKRVITIGSSKGGSAALYYSVKMGAESCIIGAPQYFIGSYLSVDKHLPILEGIMGNTSSESVETLDKVIRDVVMSPGDHKPSVHIHYSPKEHTYPEHIKDMIADLKSCGYSVAEDAEYDYTDHVDVSKCFPEYLLNELRKLL